MEKDRQGVRYTVSPLGSDFYRQQRPKYFVSSLNNDGGEVAPS